MPRPYWFERLHGVHTQRPLRLVVQDVTGRQVHEESIGTGTGTRQLAHLPLAAGLYYLHLTDGTRWLAGAKVLCTP